MLSFPSIVDRIKNVAVRQSFVFYVCACAVCARVFRLLFYTGKRSVAILQQHRDGGVPGVQGGHDAHGKNELIDVESNRGVMPLLSCTEQRFMELFVPPLVVDTFSCVSLLAHA